MSYSGKHVLNFWVVSFEKGAVSKFIYLYKVDSKLDENELSKFINLDHQSFLGEAKQSGYKRVEDKRHEIQQRMINKFNDIQDLKISSLPFPEILKFEGISLWQFVTERCYDSYPREIIELIEYITELVETFDPGEIRIFGELKDPQRNVLKLISQHYGKTVSFYEVTINTTGKGSNEAQNKHFVEPAYKKLEGGDRFVIRDYILSIRRALQKRQIKDNVLLLGYATSWTKDTDGVETDKHYNAFKTFFKQKKWEGVRLELPYYFLVDGKKEYIDDLVTGARGGFRTVFFDESYTDEHRSIAEKYKVILENSFDYFSKTPEFRKMFSWKDISFFTPLFDFWRNLFVDYLAMECITSILVARKTLLSLKPKAIFAVYEVGVYARAMIIEAHRAGIPSIGLQHAFIHQDLFYYMQKNVSNYPNLRDGFWGVVVPTKTLVYSDYHKKVLTTIGHYPDDSVSVLGSDWRLLNQKHKNFDEHKAETLRAEWFSSSKKVALILTGAFTTAIVYRLIEKLDPSRYAILVKLHPLDKNEHFYYKSFTENNFEVKVIRHYLHESIELADLIFAPLNTTVVLDCLALNKIVFYHKEFDVGGILPWENLAANMLAIDEYDKVKISKEDTIRIHKFLREIGYDRNISIKSFSTKLHRVFDNISIVEAKGADDFSVEMTVSAIIPVYNRQKTIERAIVSALQQNYPVYEIIVVDDCSTDNTVQIVEELACRDSRVKLICHDVNKGAQAARNTGIRNATGEWIAFLDSDDEWLTEKTEKQLNVALRQGVCAVHSEFLRRNHDATKSTLQKVSPYCGDIYADILTKPGPGFPSLLVKKECLERIGLLDESIISWQEWDTFIRLAKYFEFGFVSEPCFIWHWHEGHKISDDKRKEAEGYYQIVEKHADEIIKYAGTKALMNHYMITLEKLKALTAYEKFQQVKVKLKALIDSEKKELIINSGVKEVPNRMY